jgi:hypothetical protein
MEKRLEPDKPDKPVMTEEEQAEVRKMMIDCIDSGNFIIPDSVIEE